MIRRKAVLRGIYRMKARYGEKRLRWRNFLGARRAATASILFLPIALGCALWTTRAPEGPGVTDFDYKRACGACHDAPRPRSKSDEEWQAFVMDHRFLSGHDRETAQLYADYLKRKN